MVRFLLSSSIHDVVKVDVFECMLCIFNFHLFSHDQPEEDTVFCVLSIPFSDILFRIFRHS